MNITVELREHTVCAHAILDGHPFRAYIPFGPDIRSETEAAMSAVESVMELMSSYRVPNPDGRQGWGINGASYAEAPARIESPPLRSTGTGHLLETLRSIADFPVREDTFNVDVSSIMLMAQDAIDAHHEDVYLLSGMPGLSIRQEPKYTTDGRHIINRASGERIPVDEPIFMFRARDRSSVRALSYYMGMIKEREPQSQHYEAVSKRVEDFKNFHMDHPSRMKWPDTTIVPTVTDTETLLNTLASSEGGTLTTVQDGFRSAGWIAVWRMKEGHAHSPGQILHRSKIVNDARDAQLIVDQWESREPSAQFSFGYHIQELFTRVRTPQDTSDVLTSTHYAPTVNDDLGTEHPMGVCVVIAASDEPDEFLAVSRRGNGNLWGFPGGKVDPGETCAEAAVRELVEETGFRTSISMLVPIYRSLCPGDVTYDVVTYMYIGNAPTLIDLTPEDDLGLDYVTGDLLTDPETSPFAEYNLGVMKAVDQITANS